MAMIRPFCGLHPDARYTEKRVFSEASNVSIINGNKTKEAPVQLKTSAKTCAGIVTEAAESQKNAFGAINKLVQNMLRSGYLIQDQEPGIYVYESYQGSHRQTGIWVLTELKDNIKIHELTFADSIRCLKSYRECTGLEGSPILLTYQPVQTIARIISEAVENNCNVVYGNCYSQHRLWKITDCKTITRLTEAFATVTDVYLADGHHRLASARQLAKEQQTKEQKVYGTISSLYVATDQLCIHEYYRAFLPDKPIDKYPLLKNLVKGFYIVKSTDNRRIRPIELHRMGMLLDGNWYHLKPKQVGDEADATILRGRVLSDILNIADPENDPRLRYFGGPNAMEELLNLVIDNPSAICFTLCPVTMEQLLTVADSGKILPPKATWIEPKIPYGLLIFKH